jgi:glycosyltransferase involved in cell wall biosynthesis
MVDFYGVTLLLRWILGWFIQPPLTQLSGEANSGDISVIIPARNEEKNLARLLGQLANSSIKPNEIIVVDDHSTDQTSQIVKQFNVTYLESAALPPGWTGKSHALFQGVKISSGGILLFLDADTIPHKNLIAKLVFALQKNGGLISVQPYHFMNSFYERFAAIFNLIGAIGADLGSKNGLAFGPVMMMKKEDYQKIGGIESVKEQILEDRGLGFKFVENKLPVHTFIGAQDVRFQMYADGIKSLTQGFTKNIAAGSASISAKKWILLFVWFSGLTAAAWELPFAFMAWSFTGNAPSLYQYFLTIGFGIQLWFFTRKLGNFKWYLIFYPFMILYFLAIFFYSVSLTWRGQVTWKNRKIDAKRGLK